jgi:hypothetical protein
MPLRHTKTSQPSISVWFTPSINLHHGNGKVGIVSSTSTNQGGSRSHTFTTFIRTIRKKSWALLNCIQSYTAPAILRTDTISQCKGSLQTSTAKALADCTVPEQCEPLLGGGTPWNQVLIGQCSCQLKKNSWLHYAKRVRLANRTPMFAVSQNSAMHVLRVLRSKNTNAKHAWLLCLIQFQILIALHFIASHCNALHCIALHCILWIWGRRQGAWAL